MSGDSLLLNNVLNLYTCILVYLRTQLHQLVLGPTASLTVPLV